MVGSKLASVLCSLILVALAFANLILVAARVDLRPGISLYDAGWLTSVTSVALPSSLPDASPKIAALSVLAIAAILLGRFVLQNGYDARNFIRNPKVIATLLFLICFMNMFSFYTLMTRTETVTENYAIDTDQFSSHFWVSIGDQPFSTMFITDIPFDGILVRIGTYNRINSGDVILTLDSVPYNASLHRESRISAETIANGAYNQFRLRHVEFAGRTFFRIRITQSDTVGDNVVAIMIWPQANQSAHLVVNPSYTSGTNELSGYAAMSISATHVVGYPVRRADQALLTQNLAYYHDAIRIDNYSSYLSEFFQQNREHVIFGKWSRADTHLPGYTTLALVIVRTVGSDPMRFVSVLLAIASLTVFPLFYLTKKLSGLKGAVISCLIFVSVPDILVHIPWMDLATMPIVATLTLYSLTVIGNRPICWSYSAIAGLLLFVLPWMCLQALIIVLIPMIVLLLRHIQDRLQNRPTGEYGGKILTHLVVLAISFSLPFVYCQVILGLPVVQTVTNAYLTGLVTGPKVVTAHMLEALGWYPPTSILAALELLGFPLAVLLVCSPIVVGYLPHRLQRGTANDEDFFIISVLVSALVFTTILPWEMPREILFSIPLVSAVGGMTLASNNCRFSWVLVIALQFMLTYALTFILPLGNMGYVLA